MTFKVLTVFDPARVPASLSQRMAELGVEFAVVECKTESERIAACRDVDFVITGLRAFPFTRKVIEQLRRVRFIETIGIGYEGVDLDAATEHGIGILHNRGLCDDELSDHAMALILACTRWIVGLHSHVIAGHPVPAASPVAFQRMSILRGKSLGLIGFGRSGRAMVSKAQGFGMEVLAYDPFIDLAVARDMRVPSVSLDDLLTRSDFISIHANLTEQTRGLIGLPQLRKMKRNAFIVNVTRGPIIDQQALCTALAEHYIAGAGLDVTDPDPPEKDSALLQFENVIVTGHNAGASAESMEKMWTLPVEQVARVLQGEWPLWVVNEEVRARHSSKWR